MEFEHYDLRAKWSLAAALVYGRRARVREDALEGRYAAHYEDDRVPFSVALWPYGPAAGGFVPTVVGAGDLYHRLDDGRDRRKRHLPYPLAVLRREARGLDADRFARAPDLEPVDDADRWWLVGPPGVAVFFGALLPRDASPATPAGIEALRPCAPGARPHPRVLVGVALAETDDLRCVTFDPDDPRVVAAKRALAGLLPSGAELGFVSAPRR